MSRRSSVVSAESVPGATYVPAGANPRERALNLGYARGFAAARERAALIVQPEPKTRNEERECSKVAAAIRRLRPWPSRPQYDCTEPGDD